MQQVDPRHLLQELAGEMIAGAHAARSEGVLAGLGLGLGDEVGKIADRVTGAQHQAGRRFRDQADRDQRLARIEPELGVERGCCRQRRGREQERVAIRRGLHHGLRRDRAAGAAAMLQDEGALGLRRQPVDQQPRRQVERPAGGDRQDHAHRAGRPLLRRRRQRRRERAMHSNHQGGRARDHRILRKAARRGPMDSGTQ
jgi:hypothetical protein